MKTTLLVGRQRETELLHEKQASGKSEFIALYGRRRVGKTYLVRQTFAGKFVLHLTGLAGATLQQQLDNFVLTLQEQHPKTNLKKVSSWIEAFQQIKVIASFSKQKKKIIFIDELPWFDTPKSGFVSALEHFWNSWASARKDILLIVCGSAASWMINKLINNKGGLHNRVTQKLKIEPFTLAECRELLHSRKIVMDHYQLIQLYMVLGGSPYYWDGIQKGFSAAQNIQKLCFESHGLLTNEFENLYRSLFDKAWRHEAIVSALAKKGKGLTREEISAKSGLANGGGLTRLLKELEESGFIRHYVPFGKLSRNSLYQLSDFFSLFHIRFIKSQKSFSKDHWLKLIDSPVYRAWSGYAFEQVCFAHIPQIKNALGVSGVETSVFSWKSERETGNAQIDLVIDRRDQAINLCEVKFSINAFSIDKKYDTILRNKIGAFKSETRTRKSVLLTLISTFGLRQNAYSGNIQSSLTMDVLFEPS